VANAAAFVLFFAFVGALVRAKGFERFYVESDAFGQTTESVLRRILFDQLPRLVGEVGNEPDLVGVCVADSGI